MKTSHIVVGLAVLSTVAFLGFSYYTHPDYQKALCKRAIANYYESYDTTYDSMLGVSESFNKSYRKKSKAEILENCHYLDRIFIRGLEDEKKLAENKKENEAKREIVCRTMNDIKKGLDLFKQDNGVYPETAEGLESLLSNPDPDKYFNYRIKPYLKEMPKDEWGTPIIYVNQGEKFELISLAADRKEAGEGINRDLFLSQCNK